jgi:hypothetical protein
MPRYTRADIALILKNTGRSTAEAKAPADRAWVGALVASLLALTISWLIS